MVMERLLFDRRGQLVCAGLWGAAWLGVAAALLLPAAVGTPHRTDLVAHFLLFGAMAFGAVGFSRRPGQLAWLALATIALGAALEFAQKLVPYRTFDMIDAVGQRRGRARRLRGGAARPVLRDPAGRPEVRETRPPSAPRPC